jgi:hypothetical protein
MTLDSELRRLADDLLDAFWRREFRRTGSVPVRALSLAEAYRVQDLVVAARRG